MFYFGIMGIGFRSKYRFCGSSREHFMQYLEDKHSSNFPNVPFFINIKMRIKSEPRNDGIDLEKNKTKRMTCERKPRHNDG